MDFSRYRQFTGNYARIPRDTQYALTEYVTQGQPVGHFLTAVLENNLKEAFAHADDANSAALKEIVMWIYNVAPGNCQGSPGRVNDWYDQNGLTGYQISAPEQGGPNGT